MQPLRPPSPPHGIDTYPYTIFLGGSIDMGSAVNWQREAEEWIATNLPHVIAVNPRRADWDASWEQSLDNIEFAYQVSWEHYGLMNCSVVILNFLPESMSPITLLELGIMATTRPRNTIVVCPDGFYRKGNVEFICKLHNVSMVNTIEQALQIAAQELAFVMTDRVTGNPIPQDPVVERYFAIRDWTDKIKPC